MKEVDSVTSLGQVGFVFSFGMSKIVIDPYLSDYVEQKYGNDLQRQVPPPDSKFLHNVDLILITHEHEDHCDPISINNILALNPNAKIICPKECNSILESFADKIVNLKVLESFKINNIKVRLVPSAHLELEIKSGYSRWCGFIIEFNDKIIYHAGDTIPYPDMDKYLPKNIDLAFLPINERNYFRSKDGIIGNMTPREAIELVKFLNIKSWVPTHWDMFIPNMTYTEELEILGQLLDVQKHVWINAGETVNLNKLI